MDRELSTLRFQRGIAAMRDLGLHQVVGPLLRAFMATDKAKVVAEFTDGVLGSIADSLAGAAEKDAFVRMIAIQKASQEELESWATDKQAEAAALVAAGRLPFAEGVKEIADFFTSLAPSLLGFLGSSEKPVKEKEKKPRTKGPRRTSP